MNISSLPLLARHRSSNKRGSSSFSGKKAKVFTHKHCIGFLFIISFLLSIFVSSVLIIFVTLDVPNISSLDWYRPPVASRILDSNGSEVDRVFSENRSVVPLSSMPELLPKAFVAAEDDRFYQHSGVDFWSVLRAFVHNVRVGERAQGGSTITQQVTRSLLLSRKKLYSRKIKEAVFAYRLDSVLQKDEILHIYLNQIYLGEGAYGVEAAARAYFGKHVGELSLAEISLLAGLPKAPSRYSPLKNIELARKRQAYVLNRMAEEGYITPTAARRAFNKKLDLIDHRRKENGSKYFSQLVRNYVSSKYGRDILTNGGLVIHTTMDEALQREAAKSVSGVISWLFPKKLKRKPGTDTFEAPQAGLVSLDIKNGSIKAIVGGVSYADSQFDRAVQARRQPGSAFKPILYAAALEKGYTPASLVVDSPISLKGNGRNKLWEPKNFDGKFLGPTTVRTGLIESRNIVSIKLMQDVGTSSVINLARKLGIQSPLKSNLSLALGSSEVSLLELTSAYSAFGNNGKYTTPYFIEKIVDRDGNVLEINGSRSEQVLDKRTSFQITLMLQGVIESGTGRSARGLRVPAAGKTGTTDENVDAWFIGYTPDIVTGVWVGYDRKKTLGSGNTGGKIAAPIWLDFMRKATGGSKALSSFTVPVT